MKICLTIAKKELLQTFRDKSTLIFLLIPLLIFPVFNIGMDFISKNSQVEITVCTESDSEEINHFVEQFIRLNKDFEIHQVVSNCPEKLLKSGKIDCYIKIQKSDFNFFYNSSSYNSLSKTTKLGETLQRNYYSYLNKTTDGIYQFNLFNENGDTANISNSIANIFIPTIFVLLIFQGITSFSNDIFAGEKDRKTFELLLLSKVKREAIYLGKSIALLTISFVNVVISLIAFAFSYAVLDNGIHEFKFLQTESCYINILVIIIALILLAIISVFITSSISLISKNAKMAQLFNELILVIPVGITGMLCLGVFNTDNKLFDFIPILNAVNMFNKAFNGYVNLSQVILAILSTVIFVWIITILCAKYIKSEKCL